MTKEIPLTQGRFAIIDDDDYEELIKYSWSFHITYKNDGYAARSQWINGKKKIIYMHRFINNTPDDFETDHINGNKLDNRKSNLRTATGSQNITNRTYNNRLGFRGVRKHGPSYCATIRNPKIWLGVFPTAEEAARAYDDKARELFGEFARLNFPDSPRIGAQMREVQREMRAKKKGNKHELYAPKQC